LKKKRIKKTKLSKAQTKLCHAMHMTPREMLGTLAYPKPDDSNRTHMLHYNHLIIVYTLQN
jgi:hypothetical protein